MKVVIANDHGGYDLKCWLIENFKNVFWGAGRIQLLIEKVHFRTRCKMNDFDKNGSQRGHHDD